MRRMRGADKRVLLNEGKVKAMGKGQGVRGDVGDVSKDLGKIYDVISCFLKELH